MHKPLRLALLIAAIYSGGVLAQAKPLAIPAQGLGRCVELAGQARAVFRCNSMPMNSRASKRRRCRAI